MGGATQNLQATCQKSLDRTDVKCYTVFQRKTLTGKSSPLGAVAEKRRLVQAFAAQRAKQSPSRDAEKAHLQ